MTSNPTPEAPPPLPIDDAMLAKPLRDNRGVQAAKFSLYAVGMVFLLGCVLSSITNNAAKDGSDGARSTVRMVGMAIGVLNLSLIVAAFVAGIYALFAMRRFGRRGILWRAIAGVTLNGILVAATASLFLSPMLKERRINRALPGAWHLVASPTMNRGVDTNLTFRADGTYDLDMKPRVGGGSGQMSGTWTLRWPSAIRVTIDRVSPGVDQSQLGRTLLIGTVKEIDATRLVLAVQEGEERYERVP